MRKVYSQRICGPRLRAASTSAASSGSSSSIPSSSAPSSRGPSNWAARRPGRIFVVHGEGDPARLQLEVVLRRLGLEPISLGAAAAGSVSLDVLADEIDFTSD